MGNRCCKLDVSHSLSTNGRFCDFYTATVTDDATIADTLVLTTMALKVLDGTEDAFAEEPITLGLIGTVIDGLRLEHLTA